MAIVYWILGVSLLFYNLALTEIKIYTNVRKLNIDKRSLAIHVLCWGLIIFVPALLRPSERFDERLMHTCRSFGPTLCYMAVFYINYLYLIPHIYLKHRRSSFFGVNLALIITAMCVHMAWWWMLSYFHPEPFHHRGPWAPMGFVMWQTVLMALLVALAMAIRMSQHMKRVDDLRREAEKTRSEAELTNLRNQLNPHFLLNTLNNIYALIAIDPDKAQGAVQELSKLLRHVLYDNQQDFVPLDKEVAFIKNYIELMKIRVSQSVNVTTDINIDDNSHILIAPLIFISLIENAFKHGISYSAPSYIHILIEEEGGVITCEIRNSYHPKSVNDKSGSGIGLEQVQKRLSLMYDGHYEWNRGTTDDGKEYYSIIKIYTNDSEMRNR